MNRCTRCGSETYDAKTDPNAVGIKDHGVPMHPTFEDHCETCGFSFAMENGIEKIAGALLRLADLAHRRVTPPARDP